ncbi:MAG: Ldh family oxidoreductase [Planctomycetaceae bacterium]
MLLEKVQYSSEILCNFVCRLFMSAGVSESEAAEVASSLIESNLRGHESHGVLRVGDYLNALKTGELCGGVEWQLLTETPALLVADGRRGFGQVMARRLVAALALKCQTIGIACGTLKNCGHVGRLAEWVELAARSGFAAMMSVNDNGVLRCVAPPGGLDARISTNPLGLAVPTGDEPLVLDLSTSIVANGKVKARLLAGEACPPGWLQDADGNPTTDPASRFSERPGTLLPLGGESHGYKGFGLGLLLDVLIGGLSGGACPPAGPAEVGTNNVLLVLWDPARFAGTSHFLGEADKLINYVRSTPLKQGVDQITLPGDRSAAVRRERLANGIPLDAATWKMLCDAAEELGVAVP